MAALISPRTWALLDALNDTNLNAGIRDAIQQLIPITAVKSGDSVKISNTTITADPHLVIAVAANAVYDVELVVFYTQGTTGQLLAHFTGPTSATFDWSAWMLDQGVTAGNVGSVRPLRRSITDTLTMGGNTIASTALIKGRLAVSSTAGTFSFDWAQAVSQATVLTVMSGSYMVVRQIA